MKNPYTTIFRVKVASTVSNPMGGYTVSSVTGLVSEPKPNLATIMVMKAIPFKRMYNTIRIDEKQSSEKTEMLAYQFRNFENLRHFEKISWFEFYHFELFLLLPAAMIE